MILILILILLSWCANLSYAFNSFPSLISANATMAVVVDKNFYVNKDDYLNTVDVLDDLVKKIVRREMRLGGIVVHIFKDTNVTLNRDYTILLSVATCRRTWILYEMAHKEQLLHLAITDQQCPRIPNYIGISIPMVGPGEELAQIFLDLRMKDVLGWNNINVMHDEAFDRDTIYKVMKAISTRIPTKKWSIASRSVFTFKHTESDFVRRRYIKEVLTTLNNDNFGKFFLVIVTVDIISDVMEVARSLKMVHPKTQWLYVITDTATQNSTNITNFSELLAEGGNVAFIYNATEVDDSCNVGLLCHIQELVTALANALEYSLGVEIDLYDRVNDNEFDVIRLTKSERRRELLKFMNSKLSEYTARGVSCNRCLLWRFSSAITWGNFFLDSRSVAHMVDSGSWIPGTGLNLTDVLFPHVAYGFRGVSLPLVTYHNPPWQIIMPEQTGDDQYGGLTFDVIRYISKKLNFTYTVIIETDNETMKSANISLTNPQKPELSMASTNRRIPPEVINLIRKKKVLLGACAYTVNDFGKTQINFTLPILIQHYSFLTAKPKQLSRALLFASPFTNETWACLAAAIIIMGPILYWVHKYSPCSIKTSGLNSSWQCVWYVYGALLQQGGMYLPHSDSARLLIGVWWLIVMVLVATYSGSLVAFLTFPKMDDSVLTVDDVLARKNRLTWGFPNGSFLEEYLQHNEEKKYELLLARAERHNSSQEEEVIRRVKEGKHVFIDWRSSLRFLMRKDLLENGGCHFSISTDEFLDEPIAMLIAQDSPYLSIINSELHRMQESGLINKWLSEKLPAKDKCWEIAKNDQMVYKRKVNVADMQGIFFVLFMGVFGSIVLLCCELYWHRRKLAKQRKLIHPFVQ